MHTSREWHRLKDSLTAHAETAQHPTDIRRFRDAARHATSLVAYLDAAPDGLMDQAYELLQAAGLIPTADDLHAVAVIAARIREEQEIAA